MWIPRSLPHCCRERRGQLCRSTGAGFLSSSPFTADAFGHAKSHATLDQRWNTLEDEIVQSGSRLPTNLNCVFETFGGNEGNTRSFALQQGVCSDSGSV